MLATIMNGAIIRDYLRGEGLQSQILSPREVRPLTKSFARDEAISLLQRGQVLIFAGGTGNPYFTTDTAAALRAVEIGAEVLLKATKVDGVYDADPMKEPSATRYDHLSYQDVLRDQLKVLDAAAVSLCSENDLPIVVFDLNTPDNVTKVARGERVGTVISA